MSSTLAVAGCFSRSTSRSFEALCSRRAFSSTSSRSKQRLVILGSGWGGYEVLRGVDKKRWGNHTPRSDDTPTNKTYLCLDVTVVSPNNYFNFTPLLASCAVGTLEFRCAVEPVSLTPTTTMFVQLRFEPLGPKIFSSSCM